jgi:hypothetical protein
VRFTCTFTASALAVERALFTGGGQIFFATRPEWKDGVFAPLAPLGQILWMCGKTQGVARGLPPSVPLAPDDHASKKWVAPSEDRSFSCSVAQRRCSCSLSKRATMTVSVRVRLVGWRRSRVRVPLALSTSTASLSTSTASLSTSTASLSTSTASLIWARTALKKKNLEPCGGLEVNLEREETRWRCRFYLAPTNWAFFLAAMMSSWTLEGTWR